MNIDDPRWPTYESRFRALAESIELEKGPQPKLASAQAFLFLYGENGLPPEEELSLLERFEQLQDRLRGNEILTSYWEDLVLYLP